MILPSVGIASLLVAAFLLFRWASNRYDALGRKRSFPWISIGGLVVIGVACVTPLVLRLRLEATLESAASEIVGERVEVHCQAFGEAFVDAGVELGYVRFRPGGEPERSTLIKRQQCRDLATYLRTHPWEFTHEHAIAVHTLAHEAVHMSGVRNEAETECLAMQRDAELGRLLGAPPGAARALAHYYWEDVYPQMPDTYRSDDCRSGGALDAGLPDAPWD